MPRELNATILAAMNAGNFTPYFNLQLMDLNRVDAMFETTEVVGFELDGLTCKVSFHDPDYYDDFYTFRIQRGVLIDGTPHVVTSSNYWPIHDRHEKRIRTLEGHVFPNEYYSTPGDVTYGQIIDDVCTHFQLSVAMANPAAAWLSYQFLPTGRVLVLNDAKYFFTFLRQKYLIFATDFDEDMLYFYQAINTVPSFPAGYTAVTANHVEQPGHGAFKQKSFISRDESYSVHTSGSENSPIHNLGFLPSTASHPARSWFIDTQNWIIQGISPNLKYLDFDAISAAMDVVNVALWPAKFREVFNKKLSPSWQWQARFLDIFGNTEGGALPSTIEAVAPYTPLNVSNFDNNLDYTVNNLQALAEAVDELDIGKLRYMGAWSSSTHYEIKDVVDKTGVSYVCILSHTNHTPPNATYWQLAPAQGAEGPAGPGGEQGEAGDTGPAGPEGPQGEEGDPGAITEDAPDDGDIYGRKNEAWTIVTAALVGSYTTAEADLAFAAIYHDHSGVYSPVGHDHSGVYEPADSAIQSHLSDTDNPHSVTASQVGTYTTGEADLAFADIDHDHSGVYSPVGHDHSGVYEPADAAIQSHLASTSNPHSVSASQVGAYTTGEADLAFAAIGHDHAGVYSPVGHDHAGVYSPVGHNHSGVYEPVISYPLASTLGGTGKNNAGTITCATNFTVTGGGTLALAGYTLTVTSTGQAALKNIAGSFTATQTFAVPSNTTDLIIRQYISQVTPPFILQDSTSASLAFFTAGGGFTFNEQGKDVDCRIEGDTASNLFITDASLDAVRFGTTTAGAIAEFDATEITFNETGLSTLDFRVESDTYDALFIDASNDSIVLMSNAVGKIGVFGAAAVAQQTALTAQLTTITASAPVTPDYAIQDLVANGYGFVTADEGQSALSVIANLQTRVSELETRLKSYGWLP